MPPVSAAISSLVLKSLSLFLAQITTFEPSLESWRATAHRHFLPFRRADITASTSLQRIRSGRPQLHTLRLVLAAISTREQSRFSWIIHKNCRCHHSLFIIFISITGIFYLSGELISPHLLRCSAFAVEDHSFIRCASYLRQSQLVNNPRPPELFIKTADTFIYFL